MEKESIEFDYEMSRDMKKYFTVGEVASIVGLMLIITEEEKLSERWASAISFIRKLSKVMRIDLLPDDLKSALEKL